MKKNIPAGLRALPLLLLFLGTSAHATNITPYYLFDGDSEDAWEITNGVVANTFSTYRLGYPSSVRNTIWLGDRDDNEAREYTLAGVPTGNTSVGGSGFSQFLDGASGPNANYSVECCGSTDSVSVSNLDFSNQTVLFDLPAVNNRGGSGIAYDLANDTLYVSQIDTDTIWNFDLSGNLLGSFDLGQEIVGLAYEEVTDSFWGFNRSTDNLVQFNRAGTVLQDVDIPNFNPGNPWGGEMIVRIPEPTTLALFAMMLAGLGFTRRK